MADLGKGKTFPAAEESHDLWMLWREIAGSFPYFQVALVYSMERKRARCWAIPLEGEAWVRLLLLGQSRLESGSDLAVVAGQIH